MAGFQQVKVNRDLEFTGAAAYQPNVKGPQMTELKMFDECFVNDSLGDWSEEEANGATITHSLVDGGAMIITCSGSADKDVGELSHNVQWSPASNCGMEVKAKISQITVVGIAVGFVDQAETDNDEMAFEMLSAAFLTRSCVDGAVMIFDTDSTADLWYYGAENAGQNGTPVVTTLAPVANTYFKVRLQTDSDGKVTFYYNGNPVGFLGDDAIAHASTDLLTPYIGFISRSIANPVATISRVTVWQDN